jgi:hypothetical protein
MSDESTTELPPLPELSDERIAEMESALFEGIDREERTAWSAKSEQTARRHRRRLRIAGWTTAAAVVVIAALAIGPVVISLGQTSQGGSASLATTPGSVKQLAPNAGGSAAGESSGDASGSTSGSASAGQDAGRQIVATAQASVQVDDVAVAAKSIAAAAAKRGGYVESMSIGQSDAVAGGRSTGPDAATAQTGVITVRVPADQLTAAMGTLSALGTVQSSSISQQDDTPPAIHLRAPLDSLQASVARLTELLRKSASVADLLTAESALSKRQGELEAAQQQLKALESQVAMSSLTVNLVEKPAPAAAAPAGFGAGLSAGWSGLVVVFNGIVVALGFVLPWLVIAALIAAIVWLVVRRRRRSRPGGGPSGNPGAGPAGDPGAE